MRHLSRDCTNCTRRASWRSRQFVRSSGMVKAIKVWTSSTVWQQRGVGCVVDFDNCDGQKWTVICCFQPIFVGCVELEVWSLLLQCLGCICPWCCTLFHKAARLQLTKTCKLRLDDHSWSSSASMNDACFVYSVLLDLQSLCKRCMMSTIRSETDLSPEGLWTGVFLLQVSQLSKRSMLHNWRAFAMHCAHEETFITFIM